MTPAWMQLTAALLVLSVIEGATNGRVSVVLGKISDVFVHGPGVAPHPIWLPGIRLFGGLPEAVGVVIVVVWFVVFWNIGFPTYGTADDYGPKVVMHWTRRWWGPLVFALPVLYLGGSIRWEHMWPGWTP